MADYFLSSAQGNNTTGTSWATAHTTLQALLTRVTPTFNAGDRIWVGDDHTENIAANITFDFKGTTALPVFVYVVDHTVASPGLADIRIGTVSGGSIIGTTTAQLIFNGHMYAYGLYMSAGSGANSANLTLQNTGNSVFDNCKLVSAGTATGNIIVGGGNNAVTYQDCVFKVHNNSTSVNCRGPVRLIRCSWDISVVSPQLLINGNAGGTRLLMEDCDLSNVTTLTNVISQVGVNWVSAIFRRCKLPAVAVLAAPNTVGAELCDIEFIQCDSGTAVYRNEKHTGTGVQTTNIVAARVSGATEGGVALSHKVVTSASAKYPWGIRLNPYVIWNTITGTALNITIEGIADPRDFTALPKDDEVCVEAEYLGYASSTQGAKIDGQKPSPLSTAAALSASTVDWTAGSAAARANSTAYTLNTIIKVASNPGRLFICTAAGTSAASEPAAFASAVDGQTAIVDGAGALRWAVFWRFKQTLTTTGSGNTPHPQAVGYVYVAPKVYKTSAVNGVYFDPLPILS